MRVPLSGGGTEGRQARRTHGDDTGYLVGCLCCLGAAARIRTRGVAKIAPALNFQQSCTRRIGIPAVSCTSHSWWCSKIHARSETSNGTVPVPGTRPNSLILRAAAGMPPGNWRALAVVYSPRAF